MLFYMPNTKNYWLLIRDVKIVFFWYSILGTKNSIFFDYRISADARNWFRQVSSTDDESGCASSMRWRFVGGYVCSSTLQSSPAASAAALVHSSNSHCIQTLARRTVSRGGLSWINDCCDDVQALISYCETKQTSNGILPPSACFTRRVRLLLIIISRYHICPYVSAVNEYLPIYDIRLSL